MTEPDSLPLNLRAGFWALLSESNIAASFQKGFGPAVSYALGLLTDGDLNNGSVLNRRSLHVVAGVSIIVIPFILAALSRWGPRKKVWLSVFAFLLLSAIAAQVWLGLLLLYDLPVGPVTGFVIK